MDNPLWCLFFSFWFIAITGYVVENNELAIKNNVRHDRAEDILDFIEWYMYISCNMCHTDVVNEEMTWTEIERLVGSYRNEAMG